MVSSRLEVLTNLAEEAVDRTKSGSSYGFYNSDIWKVIWNLKVPKSEKHFIWRACHDILPTQDNLMRRKIVRDPLCPICGLEVETESYFIGMPLGDGCVVCVCCGRGGGGGGGGGGVGWGLEKLENPPKMLNYGTKLY
jgi:hypothetical protein